MTILVPAIVCFCCAVSCLSAPQTSSGGLPAKTFSLVQDAVFEVVIEKPAEDSTVYEKELDWDLIPFAIRNDKYYSIGTAFAVSKTELITAFHVINLGFESMVFDKYHIRDSQGKVYEIDKITGGSNEKDFLIFTVKGKTFDRFFQFERNYKAGDAVLSIGNALGEGVVIRNGLILGTVPEEDSGRWNLLKSSADGNPGNSGGPLVTPDGKVVAVVTALRENILYSTPIDVVLDSAKNALPYRNKFRFGHILLSNKLNSVFETEAPLPDTYAGVRKAIRAAYEPYYSGAMTALFKEAPEYLTGANNYYLLNSSLSSTFPEVSFVDPNDSNWKLTNFERKTYNLDDDGRLLHSAVGGINFYKIKKPASVSLEKSCTSPKYIMDLILNNIRTDRTLWGNNRYRILSLGEPSSTGNFRDFLGRTWITAHWVLGFDDDVQIMYILPLPNGPVVITTLQNSAFLKDYEWDLHKLCDHLFSAYHANFNEWGEFLSLEKYIPDFLKDMNFKWNGSEQSFSFKNSSLSINADKNVFDWSGNSEMFLAPSWYKQNNKLEHGVRKIILYRDQRGRESVYYYRNIKPDPRLGSNAMENWNDLAAEKFPFDGKAAISVKDNNGSIGAILKTSQSPSASRVLQGNVQGNLPSLLARPGESSSSDVLHSLYLSMENPQNEENLSRRFDALKDGIVIW